MPLKEYHKKRNFRKTAEPRGERPKATRVKSGRFVIQKHDATRLHYDFRLEMEGVLRSWAVPKGPSLNPADKRLAVQVEDHPMEYGTFEGTIPQGEYGGGTVMLWDRGKWIPEGDAVESWKKGVMKFTLEGERLKGAWTLVRMGKPDENGKSNWLLIKERDKFVSTKTSITEKAVTSVTTARKMEAIAAGNVEWRNGRKKTTAKKTSVAAPKGRKTAAAKPAKAVKAKPRTAKTKKTSFSDPSETDGAKKSAMLGNVSPQLATLVKSAPVGEEWVHEVKFDGYRMVAHINKGNVSLSTRNGNDWTKKFPAVVDALKEFPASQAVLDGELVALDDNGHSSFQGLQNLLRAGKPAQLAYYLFDILYLDGYDLRHCTLEDRKSLLKERYQSLQSSEVVRYSEHFRDSGDKVWKNACALKLEGIISKNLSATYEHRRSRSWVKVKCTARQEFVIGGYTEPSGARAGLGALLMGIPDKKSGKLRYSGKVGTGYTAATLKDLQRRLSKLETSENPFVNPPRGFEARGAHWVKPELVGEVSFAELTAEGMLRHSSFQGLREDKTKAEVVQEIPVDAPGRKETSRRAKAKTIPKKGVARTVRTVKKTSKQPARRVASATKARPKPKPAGSGTPDEFPLSNPGRVLFPETGYTKRDLAKYYQAVAPLALPHMINRPITLVRCPDGRSKPCFYQRHPGPEVPEGMTLVPVTHKSKTETYISVTSETGLLNLVQISALEIHGWQCRADDTEHPDKLVFDADPAPDVPWEQTILTAQRLRKILEGAGLVPFPMTTGGKGLHVVVPLKRGATWDEVKEFTHAVAQALEKSYPDQYISTMSKAKRTGKIFIDYLRNAKTASAILPYSARARDGATVAMPLSWREVTARLDPNDFTIASVPGRLKKRKSDPWQDYERSRKPLKLKA